MIALLIVAHGNLGDSLIQCATYVLGKRPEALENLDLSACKDPAEMLARAQSRLDEVDRGDGVLILTDVYGATPCNTVCKILNTRQVEAIAGVNLPMLLRSLCYRHEPLAALAQRALAGGAGGVVEVPAPPADQPANPTAP